jgi:hypothetical protein
MQYIDLPKGGDYYPCSIPGLEFRRSIFQFDKIDDRLDY